MLAVQAEFLARAHGIEVPVPLFKVRGKIFHAVFFFEFRARFVERRRVFEGGNGKRGGKIILFQRRGFFRRFFQTERAAEAASLPALRVRRPPRGDLIKLFGIVRFFRQLYIPKRAEFSLFAQPLFVFLRRKDVRVVIIYRKVERLAQQFDDVRGTRCAAAVQQQRFPLPAFFSAASVFSISFR